MVAGDSNLHPRVIVVGDRGVHFVNEAIRVAQECELDMIRCDDVYSAVKELAKSAHRRFMVVGAVSELAKETGRFFSLAQENGVRCCCLLDEEGVAKREEVLAAVRKGAHLVGGTEEMREFIENWLAAGGCHSESPGANSFLSEDLRATEAELRALLGQETDG